RNIDWFVLTTGQSGPNFWKQYDDFSLPRQRAVELFSAKEDLKNSKKAAKWFFKVLPTSPKYIKKKLQDKFSRTPQVSDYWVVHGDTFSTLIGSIFGRRLKLK